MAASSTGGGGSLRYRRCVTSVLPSFYQVMILELRFFCELQIISNVIDL